MADRQVNLVNTSEQFAQLQGDWNTLFERARPGNIFLTFDWLKTWWDYFGQDYEPWILTLGDANSLTGILPLMRERSRDGMRRLLFMGTGDVLPSRLDIIAPARDREQITCRFWDWLLEQRDEWDVLDLQEIDAESTYIELATQESSRRRAHWSAQVTAPNHFITLPPSFDEYLRSLGGKTRGDLRNHQNRLRREFPDARMARVETADELDMAFDALVRLHQTRWNERGKDGAFADPWFTHFHRTMARSGLANRTLRMYYLTVAGKIVAVYYAYRSGDRILDYQAGFDTAWREHSVGNLVLNYAIEQSIAEGAREFDFLQGDEAYKVHWANGVRDIYAVCASSPQWRGQLAWVRLRSQEQARRWARQWVPRPARRTAKRLLKRTIHRRG